MLYVVYRTVPLIKSFQVTWSHGRIVARAMPHQVPCRLHGVRERLLTFICGRPGICGLRVGAVIKKHCDARCYSPAIRAHLMSSVGNNNQQKGAVCEILKALFLE